MVWMDGLRGIIRVVMFILGADTGDTKKIERFPMGVGSRGGGIDCLIGHSVVL